MKKIIILISLLFMGCASDKVKYSKVNDGSDHFFDQYYYEWLNNHYYKTEKPKVQISANFGNIDYYGMCIFREDANESEIIVNKIKFEQITQDQRSIVMNKLYSRCYVPDHNMPYEYIVNSL